MSGKTKRLRLRVVESVGIPGMFSLRLAKKAPAGHLGGRQLRAGIAAAGFVPGDVLVAVPEAEFKALRSQARAKAVTP